MLIVYTVTMYIKDTKDYASTVNNQICFSVNGLGKTEKACKIDAQRQIRSVKRGLQYEMVLIEKN